jgi:hypothetical protein
VLEAVTPLTLTVCELELHQAEVRVQVVVVEELTVISPVPTIEFQFIVFNHTTPVLPHTEVTGNAMLVSVIPVTCQSVLVVIVGTLVEVHLEVYAVCVLRASCLASTAVLTAFCDG